MELKLNNNNAVIYARYSSDAQTEQSIEGQIRVIQDYAKRNSIRIIDSYIDRAISGLREDRPEFQRMIKESKLKNFGYVLVYKYDRFSRDRLNSLVYKRELKKNGVKVMSVTEYISDDPQGILFESIIDGYSEYYSAELAQKVKRGNRESRLKGLYTGGIVPYGYKIVDKKYVIVPEEAEVIKKIFRDVINKKTYQEICDEINSKGIRNKDGRIFRASYIGTVIVNEKYMGLVTVDGEEFYNIVPAIIDKETFECAKYNTTHNQRRSPHFRARTKYLLSGMVYCGYCGEFLVGETGTSKTAKVHTYYKCNSQKKKKRQCDKATVKREWLEETVVDAARTVLSKTEYINLLADEMTKIFNNTVLDDKELDVNEKNIYKVKKEIDNIVNIMAGGFVNDSLKERLSKLDEERKQLEIENVHLKTKSKTTITKEDVKYFLQTFIKMDITDDNYKQRIIDRFIRKVILFDDRVLIELYPLGYYATFGEQKKSRIDVSIYDNMTEVESPKGLDSTIKLNQLDGTMIIEKRLDQTAWSL